MNRRVRVLVAVSFIIFSFVFLISEAVTSDKSSVEASNSKAGGKEYPSHYTLITTQSSGGFAFGTGSAVIVAPDGEQIWKYGPPNTRIFDGEVTDRGTILLATGKRISAQRCPPRYRDGGSCVRNRVVEVAPSNKSVVWKYGWYDEFRRHHVVHDADRLENGWTAIADMGNHRAFAVNKQGTVVWSWHASESIAEGTPFHRKYGGPAQKSPESDWTHINDIDRLKNGNFQLSIRNFDVVLEVEPKTNNIVVVIGEPGNHSILNRQHNPHRLERADTVIVADSENNRVVELDVDTGKVLWSYYGGNVGQHLAWPRDADRLQNGNTLITDSRNFRVIEVTPSGQVVWQYSQQNERAMIYEADRLNVAATDRPERLREAFSDRPEEPTDVPSARTFSAGGNGENRVVRFLYWLSSWAGYFFPWMRLAETLAVIIVALASAWAGSELVVDYLNS